MKSFEDDLKELEDLRHRAEQQVVANKGHEAFMAERAKQNPVRKLAGDLYRGGTRAIREDVLYGAGDFVGDSMESLGIDPKYRDNWATRQKHERDPVVAGNSGSLAERGARMVGQAAMMPGFGPGATIGQTAARGAATGFGEGLIFSDEDDIWEKAKDALVSAGLGGLFPTLFHAVTRGTAVNSPGAVAQEKAFARELDDRISDFIPLGKRISDSDDIGSKITNTVQKAVQKGKHGAEVKGLDQRVWDDNFQLELQDTFRGLPHALEAAKGQLRDDRNWRNSVDIGSAVAAGERLGASSDVATQKLRALQRATHAAEETHGRFSHRQAKEQGVSNFARGGDGVMSYSGKRVEKPGTAPKVGMPEYAAVAAGVASGNPALGVVGGIPLAMKMSAMGKHHRQAKHFAGQDHQFISRVEDLPKIENPKLGQFLTGDLPAQLEYKKFIQEGGTEAAFLENRLTTLGATMGAGDRE